MTVRRILTLAVALLALLATGTVAAASDTDGTDGTDRRHGPPAAVLDLTIMVDVGISAHATLTCSPAGGNHPKAATACMDLARAGGNFDRLPQKNVMCTMEYAPVTAAATGHWRGKPVAWRKTFSNRCVMHVGTGAVFQF